MESISNIKSRPLVFQFFILSAASLFLELLIIRWMSSEIRAFSVFKTFPLVACFLGLGAGYALSREDLFKTSVWALLLFAAIVKIADFSLISLQPFPSFGVLDWKDSFSAQSDIFHRLLLFFVALPIITFAPFFLMTCIGSRLGKLFNDFKPLNAYCINIGGAIVGGLLFSFASVYGVSPGILILIPGIVIAFYTSQPKIKEMLLSLAAVVLTALFVSNSSPNYNNSMTFWSPYQRIDLASILIKTSDQEKKEISIGDTLYANRAAYQTTVNWPNINNNLGRIDPAVIDLCVAAQKQYKVPFYLHKPKSVLIVGAGMGNDAVYALENNVASVDAVDIDPVILKLGKLYHPLHPYSSSKVQLFCNDARFYFNNCDKKYDMIILGHLDSQSVTAGSSLRLDNFVYTKESFAAIQKLLKPDGLAITSFCTKKSWFADRLYKTIRQAIGYEPVELVDKNKFVSSTIFVFGNPVKEKSLQIPAPVSQSYDIVANHPANDARILSDDWPYLYVTPNLFDLPYWAIVLELVLLALVLGKFVLKGYEQKLDWQMFFLGAAFMLVELQSISRLSLIYGSTWLTTAVVINAILVMILFANLAVIKWQKVLSNKIDVLYFLLLISLLLSYSLPYLTHDAPPGQNLNLLITFMTVLPVLIASIIFSVSFAKVSSSKDALAMNLFGAFLGGLLEYCSNYIGINGLLGVVAVLYLISYIAFRRQLIPQKAM